MCVRIEGLSVMSRPDWQIHSSQCPLGEGSRGHFCPCQFPFKSFAIHIKGSGAFLDTIARKELLQQQQGPSLWFYLPEALATHYFLDYILPAVWTRYICGHQKNAVRLNLEGCWRKGNNVARKKGHRRN